MFRKWGRRDSIYEHVCVCVCVCVGARACGACGGVILQPVNDIHAGLGLFPIDAELKVCLSDPPTHSSYFAFDAGTSAS